MVHIVSVYSYRGGTGRSNTVANLAVLLAQRGKRVAVIDTDLQSPGIHVLFGYRSSDFSVTLNDYLLDNAAIQRAAYNITPTLPDISATPGSLFLVPASADPTAMARVLREGYDIHRLYDGFTKLVNAHHLDYLILDTHAGLNEELLLSAKIADTLLIVLRPDQQNYQGTDIAVDIARKLKVRHPLLLVNSTPAAIDFRHLGKQVSDRYGIEVAGILPYAEEMAALGDSEVFAIRYPHHSISHILNTVLDRSFR